MTNRDDWDTFDDIRHNSMGMFEGAGIGGGGAAAVDAVATKATEEGMAFEFMCQGCGRQRVLTLDYAELVALHYGLSPDQAFGRFPQFCAEPTQWAYQNHPDNAWGLNMRCNRGCKYHYPLRLKTNEPGQYLARAKKAGYLNPQGEAAVHQHCRHLLKAGARPQTPGRR